MKRVNEGGSEGIGIRVRPVCYEIAALWVSAVPVSRALSLKRTDVELNSVEQLFILMFRVHIGLLLCNALPALPILGTAPVVQYVMS